MWHVCELYAEYLELLVGVAMLAEAQDATEAIKTTLGQVKTHLASLELCDGSECLSRLLSNFIAELGTPSEQRVQALRSYSGLLQSLFQLPAEGQDAPVKRHGSRRDARLRRLFSLELLDLAARFSVDLDRVEVNVLSHAQTAAPQDPGMVGVVAGADAQAPEDLVADEYRRYPSLVTLMGQRSPSDVLSSAATLYGLLLSYDPHVMTQARDALYDAATVRSDPTEEGVKEIDGSHALYGLHVGV